MKNYISIVIPVFNRPYGIISALESIKSQNKINIEIIIIDDSNDNTSQKIKEFIANNTQISIYHIQPNKRAGISKSRNIGISASNGNIVLFLDSDDILIDGAINNVENAFSRNSNLNLYFGSSLYKSSYRNYYVDKKLPAFGTYIDYIRSINQPEMLPAFRKRGGNKDIYLYDESLTGFEQILYMNILKKGGIFFRDPEFVRLYDDQGLDRLCLTNPKNFINMRSGYLKLIKHFGLELLFYNPKTFLLYLIKVVVYNRLIEDKKFFSISNFMGLFIPLPRFIIKKIINKFKYLIY